MPLDRPAAAVRVARTLVLALAAGGPVAVAGLAPGAQPVPPATARADGAPADTDLPIRRITLYRSGVGFFQREARITGDAGVQLRFEADQVNDILKSLVLLDLDGGAVGTVSYASKEPLARRLASFGVNIADNPSLPQLFDRLRGATVAVTTSEGTINGTILGVETRTVPAGGRDQPPIETPFLNLVTSTGIRSVGIPSITAFQLADPDLAAELSRALAALAEYRADRSKTVDLAFTGTGQRRVLVGYVHEMPVWKTSYRLILPDGPGATTATVQGWAIVENTTDTDWTDVSLSLVSGRPVSFQMDLYEPLFTQRPSVPVPTIPGVMPRAFEQGASGELEKALADAAAPPPAASAGRRMREESLGNRITTGLARTRAGGERADEALTSDDMDRYAPAAAATAGEAGEVFQYTVNAPVTVARRRSAMIPILSTGLEARRVSVYNMSDRADHPMRGIEVRNTSGLQLLPGPITVFDGAAYAGDATIGHVGAGDNRLLAYAVDLEVAVLTEPRHDSSIVRLRIVDGLVQRTVRERSETRYAFENRDEQRERLLVVEHPRLPGWNLVAPTEPAEQTQNLYRFELPVKPGGTGALAVAQERTTAESIAVTEFDLPTILALHRDGRLSDSVLEVFRTVAARQAEIASAENALAELDRQRESIGTEQARIRQNMGAVDRTSELYGRYVKKLSEQETELERLAARRAELQSKRDAMRAELDAYLRGLDVE